MLPSEVLLKNETDSSKKTITTYPRPTNEATNEKVKTTYPRPTNEAADATAASPASSDMSAELSPSQTQSLLFPIGCKVCTHSETPMIRGHVTKVHWKVVNGEASHLYEVTDCSTSSTHLLEKTQLRFASGCPVVYSPSGTYDDENAIVGKVLTCQKIHEDDEKYFIYTVTIDTSSDETCEGSVGVIDDVAPFQIKFYYATLDTASPKRVRANHNVKKRAKPVEAREQKVKAKEPITKSEHPSSESAILEPNDLDVIRGRGGGTNHHPGNKLFRDEALKIVPVYSLPETTKEEKGALALQLVHAAKARGSRFLGKAKDGLWYHLTARAEKNKASQSKKCYVCQCHFRRQSTNPLHTFIHYSSLA